MMRLWSHLRRLRNQEDGSALVEFAFVLPLMLLIFAVTIEGSRTFWAYQTTIAGVRDATRFIARAEPAEVCSQGGDLSHWNQRATDIVRNSSAGTNLFPTSITVTSVTPTLTCVTGNYTLTQVPLATVTAQLEISYPFSGFFGFFNLQLPSVNTTVTDTGRIFGA